MKTVLEFGIRGGWHVDNTVLPTVKLGMRMARHMVAAFTGNEHVRETYFAVGKHDARITWQSDTHFVALSLLDGVPRGSASAKLWEPKP